MADVKNDWLGYLDRSYQQIKDSLLSRVTTSNPELTDHSESNIFIIIIEMFAAIAEMIGYYIDQMAEDSFLATAQRKSSVIKHTRALDYRIKTRHPEQVDIVITWTVPAPSAFVIDSGVTIQNTAGVLFTSPSAVAVAAGATSTIIPMMQVTRIDQPAFTTTDGTKRQAINLGTQYVHKSLDMFINGNEYTEVDTFAFARATSRVFIVEVLDDGNAYAILGDGKKGILETNGLDIDLTYYNCLGADARTGAGKFDKNTLANIGSLPIGLDIADANSVVSSSAGTDYESLEDIRDNAILSIRTMNRMVSKTDHVDVMQAVPGVGKAQYHFCCGKNIDIYIVPAGGGIPSTLLIAECQAEAEDKKMVATFPVVNPAGETYLVLIGTATARKRKSTSETKAQIVAALTDFGSITNQEINGAIRLSDIQALIDNLVNVDFVDITGMYTRPYARPRNHTAVLQWTNLTKVGSIIPVHWRVDYVGSSKFRIFRESVFQAEVSIGATYIAEDNIFEMTIQAGAYVPGEIWEFTTYPYLRNIELDDFTIFRIQASDININVVAAPVTVATKC